MGEKTRWKWAMPQGERSAVEKPQTKLVRLEVEWRVSSGPLPGLEWIEAKGILA